MFIFVKNPGNEGKIAAIDEKRGFDLQSPGRDPRDTPSGISHILSGRNKPGFDLLQKILRRFPRINPDWLLLDSPQMYRSDSEADRNTTNNPKQ